MARNAKSKPRLKAGPGAEQEGLLRLEYDLNRLPTPQHRAGLAGLILQIKAMNPQKAPIIEAIGLHSATIAFSKQSMVDLLDDLYDAAKVETEFAKPWKDSEKNIIPPVRTIEQTIEVDGKKKQATKYVYEVTEPKCSLMARRVAKTHPLLRLLREQIKLVIRTVPKARRSVHGSCRDGAFGHRRDPVGTDHEV